MSVLSRIRQGGAGDSITTWWRHLPQSAKWLFALLGFGIAVLLPYIPEVPVLSTIFAPPGSDLSSVLFYPVGCYVIVAIGLNIVVGQAGLLDLGYVAFFAIGAYTTAVLGSAHGDVPWIVTVPIGVLVAMTAGVLLGLPTLRLRGDYLAIVTLGFGEIVRISANNSDWLGGPRGIQNIPKPPSILGLHFGVLDAKPYYWALLIGIVLVILVYKALEHSRVGRAWLAIREDEDAAELMGVPTFRFKLWAFAMGAAIGGFSGTFYAGFAGSITPDPFNLTLSILFIAAVVLGGSGNLVGAIVGAVVIGYLPERFRGFSQYRVLVFGAALVVMMIFRPQGLVPNRRRAAEIEDRRERWNMADAILEVDALTMRFGGLTALDAVSFTIERGQIFGLIGPNGAGKTTCFNAITGVYRATSGTITFDGTVLGPQKRFEITKLGIARTFQNIRLFPEMTALENVMVGGDTHHLTSVPGALFMRPFRHRREETSGRARAIELLELVGIADRSDDAARNLPYGYQRRLEIARALATEPKLLCLDEPAAGFNPAEKSQLMALIRGIRDLGYTVLLIEHDMGLVMGVTDRIAVLDFGRKIAEGTPGEVRQDPAVIQAYLGVPADAS